MSANVGLLPTSTAHYFPRPLADIESPWKTDDRTPGISVTRTVNGVDDKNNRYTDGPRRRIYELPNFDGYARFRFI